MTELQLDESLLMSPAFIEDRYSVYDMIRSKDRLLWVDTRRGGQWVATGYRCVKEVLQNHEKFSSDRRLWTGFQGFSPEQEVGHLMVSMDPPEHTRVRAPAQKVLTPRGVEQFRPMVEKLADEILTTAADRGEMDIMTDFADLLPLKVLGEMLGVPAGEEEFFKNYTAMVLDNLDVASHTFKTQSDAINKARATVHQYFADLIDERRKNPRQDLISQMLAAEGSGDRITSDELRGLCVAIMNAGLEPSCYAIGNAINALFEYPGELERLQADPDLMATTALEEFLRYDAPIHLGPARVVREDMELDGHQLQKGQLVVWFIGAANRDPEGFPDPNRLDLTRKPNPHLTFGHGIHRCVGAPVAKLALSVAVPALINRFPDMRPAGKAERHINPHAYAFRSLPVTLS